MLSTCSTSTIHNSLIPRLTSYTSRDFISSLPRELSAHILGFLPIKTVHHISRVCKTWKFMTESNLLWRKACKDRKWPVHDQSVRYFMDVLMARMKEFRKRTKSLAMYRDDSAMDVDDVNYLVNLGKRKSLLDSTSSNNSAGGNATTCRQPYCVQHGRGLSDEELEQFGLDVEQYVSSAMSFLGHPGLVNSPLYNDEEIPIDRLWKYIYRQNEILDNVWESGDFEFRRIEDAHAEGIYCVQSDDSKIITGGRDNVIRVWNIGTLQEEMCMAGHTGSVLCLQFDENIVVSGSSDSFIKVWDIHTGECLHTLAGHEQSVLNIRMDDEFIVSCSKDKNVRVWSRQNYQCVRILRGHRAAVNSVAFVGDIIVSGSGDRFVKIWNIRTGNCIRSIAGHTRGIACVAFDGKRIVSGSSDKTIRIWNLEGVCLRTVELHTDLVRTITFDSTGDRVISGSYDGRINIWNFETGELIWSIRMLEYTRPHQNLHPATSRQRVFNLTFDRSRLIAGGQDTILGVWEFRKMGYVGQKLHVPLSSGSSSVSS